MTWATTTTCVCPSPSPPSRCLWACNSFHHSRKATLKAAEVTLQTRDFIFFKEISLPVFKKIKSSPPCHGRKWLGPQRSSQARHHALRGSGIIKATAMPRTQLLSRAFQTSPPCSCTPSLLGHQSCLYTCRRASGLHHRLPMLCRNWGHWPHPYNQVTWFSHVPGQPGGPGHPQLPSLMWPLYSILCGRRHPCLPIFPLDQIPESSPIYMQEI